MNRIVVTLAALAMLAPWALADRRPSGMGCQFIAFRKCQVEHDAFTFERDSVEGRKKFDKISDDCYRQTRQYGEYDRVQGLWIDVPDGNAADMARAWAGCQKCKASTPGKGGYWDCTDDPAMFGFGSGFGGTTYGGATTPPPADHADELARCFEQSVQDKLKEGYFVKNDGFWKGLRHDIQDLTWWANTEKGGRCGEYGERGMRWIKPCVDRLFGPNAIVDDIIVEEKSSVRARQPGADFSSRWNPDLMFEANHRATRVVLPDGRRFVVDYWDAISTGQGKMVPEDEWTDKWKKLVGDQLIGIDSGVVALSEDQIRLKDLIKKYPNEQDAFDVYRKTYNPKTVGNGKVKGDPETWINSWKRDPW